MSFIGMVMGNKEFENIKMELANDIKEKNWNIIPINKQNIENLQNIKFETIIMEEDPKKLEEKAKELHQICENAKYILLNSDKKQNLELGKEKVKMITYGLNQKATVTISSITEENLLISLQRDIETIQGNKIEVEEKQVKIDPNKKLKIYDQLILYSLKNLYEER